MAALSLYEYANDQRPLVAGVAKILRENSKWMDILPFEDIGALSIKVAREGGMPSLSWRRAGNAHGSVKAVKPTEADEQAYSIGNSIDIDKMYMKDKSPRLYNPLTYQMDMTVKSVARNFTNACINGLPTDLDNPVGLYYRIMNDLPATQRITADPAGASAGLDISPDAASLAANVKSYFDKLDVLIYTVCDSLDAEGKGVYLLMNDTTLLRHQSLARQSGMVQTTTDALGRVWTSYKGAMLVDMGYKDDDATRVIGNVEKLDGTSLTTGTAASIYGTRIAKECLTGWQEYSLDVSDPQLTDDQVTYRSVIDWVVGIAVSHPRSVARLYGVVAA
jgi:hypothetical protein